MRLLLLLPVLLLPRLGFLVITLLFDFLPLNQIDQDVHTKYTLSSDAELILIRSLTLGKVTGELSADGHPIPPLPRVVNVMNTLSLCREGELQREGGAGRVQGFCRLPVVGPVQPRGPAEGGAGEPREFPGHRPRASGPVQLWLAGGVHLTHAAR